MPAIEIFLHQERPIDPQSVHSLYASVEWWSERTEEQIADILSSNVAIGAWDGDRLIGFARVISDFRLYAYIEDVVVDLAYQRKGIGGLLFERLKEVLSRIEIITLFCDVGLILFMKNKTFELFRAKGLCIGDA